MDNKKNNEYFVGKILVDLEFLIKHTKDITKMNLERMNYY